MTIRLYGVNLQLKQNNLLLWQYKMTTKQIGKTVAFLRKQSGLTQKKLADLAGVGKTVVFDIEKGKETVQINSLLKVFSVLNIKLQLSNPVIHLMEKSDEES